MSLLSFFSFLFLIRSAARDQADGQDNQRHRDEATAGSRHNRSGRPLIGLSESHMEEEATRLAYDPQEQKQAGEPLNSG
jgi:hypothetical protein